VSGAEVTFGLLLVVSIGVLTRRAVRGQLSGQEAGEVADTPPASAPLLGVVPPPRAEMPLDGTVPRF